MPSAHARVTSLETIGEEIHGHADFTACDECLEQYLSGAVHPLGQSD